MARSYRDMRETGIEAARFLKTRNPGAKITVTETRGGTAVPFARAVYYALLRFRRPGHSNRGSVSSFR